MRYVTIIFGLFLVLSSSPAHAESMAESVSNQLAGYGYHSIKTETTLLGRIRVTAERDGVTREIVVNRWTGTILLDRFIHSPSGNLRTLGDRSWTESDDDSGSSTDSATDGSDDDHEADDDDGSDDDEADETDSDSDSSEHTD